MKSNKSPNIIRYCIFISTAAIVLIVIYLIPVARKAGYWNRCIVKTVRWINEFEKDLKGWDKEAKESLAVGVCNGAVYEPRFQTIK